MILIINSWKCGCSSKWALSTDKDSVQYQVEKALIQADVVLHRVKCKEFAKLCGYVEYSEVSVEQ